MAMSKIPFDWDDTSVNPPSTSDPAVGSARRTTNAEPHWHHVVITAYHPNNKQATQKLGDCLSPLYISPQQIVNDDNGVPRVLSNGRYLTIYNDVIPTWSSTLTYKWSTKKELYDTLPTTPRRVNNAVKAFVNNENVHALMVFHEPTRAQQGKDGCVTGPINHVHIVVGLKEAIALTQFETYRALVRATRQCYYKCLTHKVDELDELMGCLKKEGYTMFGTNSALLGQAYNNAAGRGYVSPLLIDAHEVIDDTSFKKWKPVAFCDTQAAAKRDNSFEPEEYELTVGLTYCESEQKQAQCSKRPCDNPCVAVPKRVKRDDSSVQSMKERMENEARVRGWLYVSDEDDVCAV